MRIEVIDQIKSSTDDPIISQSKQRYGDDFVFDNARDIPDYQTIQTWIGAVASISFRDNITAGTPNPKNYLVSDMTGITSDMPIVLQTIPYVDPETGLPVTDKWTTIGANTIVVYNMSGSDLVSIDVYGNDDGGNFAQDTKIRIT